MTSRPTQTRFRVEGMDCTSCAAKIAAAVRRLPGVADISLAVTAGTMTVKHDDSADLGVLQKKVNGLGYKISPLTAKTVTSSSPAAACYGHDHKDHTFENRKHEGNDPSAHDHASGNAVVTTSYDVKPRDRQNKSDVLSSFRIRETLFVPSKNGQIVRSSDDMGWADIAGFISHTPNTGENYYAPNPYVHIGLSLKAFTCELESDRFSGRADLASGSTSIIPPQSGLTTKLVTPTAVCHAYIRPSLFTEVSEEVYGRRFDHIDLIQHFGSSDSTLSHLMHSFHHLLLDSQEDRFRNEYVSRAIAAQVLTKFAQANGTRRCIDVRTALTRTQVSVIDDFLAANLHGRFLLSDLAASIGLSRTVFFKRFAHTMRQTPNQYLQKLRVARAKQLLEKSDLSLAEVAQTSGFSDQSHMTLFFTRHMGMTPGRYRISAM